MTKTLNDKRKRTFTFGKIAMWPKSRKSNLVEVDICLEPARCGETVFSACGRVWNCRHTDIISGGQCLDELLDFVDDPILKEIHDLWKKYHLNNLKCGTKRQIAALDEETERRNAIHREKGEDEEMPLTYADRYDDACEYLKSIGLYMDTLAEDEFIECQGHPAFDREHYLYGHGWLCHRIPDADMKRMESLVDEGRVYD